MLVVGRGGDARRVILRVLFDIYALIRIPAVIDGMEKQTIVPKGLLPVPYHH